MTYSTADARQELLDAIADAIDEIGLALAGLGVAYEQLDDQTADRLEEELFRPIQLAYGRGKRTHAGFAERYGLRARELTSSSPGLASQGVRILIEHAVQAAEQADDMLGTLQDSMKPIEVGDEELRAGLSEVRRLIGDLPARSRTFTRTLGR